MPRKSVSVPSRSGRSMLLVVLGLAMASTVALILIPSTREMLVGALGGGELDDGSGFLMVRAEKKPFRVVITENGTVDSLRNATLTNTVEGSTTIIGLVAEGSQVQGPVKTEIAGTVRFVDTESESSKIIAVDGEDGESKEYEAILGEFSEVLVEEGQVVKKGDYLSGDVVCELDSSQMIEKERQQQIDVTAARANLEKAIKNLEIQKTTNEGNIAQARLAEELAQLDFEKYTAEDGEYSQQVDTLKGDIKRLEEELAMAQEDYDRIREQARRGYLPLNQLEAARTKVTQTQISLDVKEGELKVLERFTHRRQVSELKQTAEDSRRETERVRLEGEAALAQMQADLDAAKLTLDVEEEKLDRLIRQIRASRMVAPQTGEVVYASQESRRSEPVVIEEGATVRERQAIIKLPDLSSMKIDARIHESKISRVMVGQPVEIEVDALPDVPFRGRLQSVSAVPVPGSWPNTDLKEYEAVVEIESGSELTSKELKPGMTALVKIIVEDRKDDVLQVPVQAVFATAGQYFCYVFAGGAPERRKIVIGDANDEYMEIVEGVTESERVIMNPKSNKALQSEISDLEQRLSAEMEANRPRVETPERPSGSASAAGGNQAAGGAGRPGGAGGGGAPGGFNPATIFTSLDKNGDGAITEDESDLRGKFSDVDKDGDGKVTLEELQESFRSMQSRS